MTLVIVVYVPEGIVMASDSRQSVAIKGKKPDGKEIKFETVNSDAITKTFLLEEQQVGISTFGEDLLAGVPMASHIKKFIEEDLVAADDVTTIPKKLVGYFRESFPTAGVGFHVAGYKKKDKVSIPYVYYCHVAQNIVERRNIKPDGSLDYGATWSGQVDVIVSIVNPVIVKDEKGNDKVVQSPAPIIWKAMALQDAIDFAIYAIRTTIDTMRFQARPKNVGGPIDVLLLVPEEAKFLQRKELSGS
ncbi:MAG: hypothetical protein PHD13_04150 [Methanocellales archaeon]|nr:hypothetical protein [Methanocellales archaeon]MDD3292109.1 hypothetical protein [Methanocellales archaeon]MDD5235346.1 hypothetical protein [Methanocellales archaeon]MDD5485706.1 hypothetical protein [Methanocellales archaeon]